jgi:cytochrome P450
LRGLARYGDVARYRVATVTFYQVNHPDGVRRVLQENNRNYGKGKMTRGVLGPLLGEGLFISEGETWLRQRRLMQPSSTAGASPPRGTDDRRDPRHARPWEQSVSAGTPLDVSAEMARLTLDVATEALFSSHVGEEPNAIARAVTTLVEDVSFRFEVPFYPPLRVPTPHNRRVRAALRTLDGAVYRIIEERRRRGGAARTSWHCSWRRATKRPAPP